MRRDPRNTAAITQWFLTHRRAGYLLFAAVGLLVLLMEPSSAERGAVSEVCAPVLLTAGLAGLVAELICPGSTSATDRASPTQTKAWAVAALL